MSSAVLDETLLPILENATERVIIRSKDGRLLGVFRPNIDNPGENTRESPYSLEEVKAIQENPGECLPLEEVWRRIKGQ